MDQLPALIAPALDVPPGRLWLESLQWLAPSPLATRWLLLADLAVIATLAVRSRWPLLTLPGALVGGLLVVTGLGMLLTDFYLGLLLFHTLTGLGALAASGWRRWLGAGLLALTLGLGLAT